MRPRTVSACAAAMCLALFLAACQPGEGHSDASTGAPEAGGPEQAAVAGEIRKNDPDHPLVDYAKGDLSRLDLTHGDKVLPGDVLIDESGEATSLDTYRGRVVVLNLWGDWCPPCIDEMPTLAALQTKFDKAEVAVVPVALGPTKGRQKAADTLRKLTDGTLPFLFDERFEVSSELGVGDFPTTIVFDRSGKEVARLSYPADWASDEAVALVRKVETGDS